MGLKGLRDINEKERTERIKAERERDEAVNNCERRFVELQVSVFKMNFAKFVFC